MIKTLKYSLLFLGAMLACAGCTEDKTYAIPEVYPAEPDVPVDVDPPHEVRARKDKNSAWGDYLAYTVDRISGFVPGQDPETDKYGGWKVSSLAATGFFRVEQFAGRCGW